MRFTVAMAILIVALAACGGNRPVGETTVTLDEFSIDPATSRLAAGEITLGLNNNGELPHTVVISRQSGEVLFASGVLLGGDVADMVVELEAGEYQFTCRIVAEIGGQLLDHFELGMVRSITVEG